MSRKLLIKLINTSIVFIGVLVLLQSVFVVLKSFQDNSGLEYQLIANAEEKTTVKYKPIYNILEIDTSEKKEKIEIDNKEDVILVFNDYFKSLTESGGYSIEGSSVIMGTANILGGITAYQATYFYSEAKPDNSFYFENGTAEVEGPNGKSTGQGINLYVKRWVNGKTSKSQSTGNVSVSKSNDRYTLTPDFNGTNIVEEAEREISTLFKFEVNQESIESCNIIKKAFAYIVDLTINSNGLKRSIEHIRKESGAVKDPTYNYFKVNLTINTYGEVLSITTNEEYTVTVNRPIIGNINSLTKDNCAYIISTPKTGFQPKSEY